MHDSVVRAVDDAVDGTECNEEPSCVDEVFRDDVGRDAEGDESVEEDGRLEKVQKVIAGPGVSQLGLRRVISCIQLHASRMMQDPHAPDLRMVVRTPRLHPR